MILLKMLKKTNLYYASQMGWYLYKQSKIYPKKKKFFFPKRLHITFLSNCGKAAS